MVKIENWQIKTAESDKYTAPELRPIRVKGQVVGHDRFADGNWITSSPIIAAEGLTLTTATGSRYELGDVDPAYLAWLAEAGQEFNPEQPVIIG